MINRCIKLPFVGELQFFAGKGTGGISRRDAISDWMGNAMGCGRET